MGHTNHGGLLAQVLAVVSKNFVPRRPLLPIALCQIYKLNFPLVSPFVKVGQLIIDKGKRIQLEFHSSSQANLKEINDTILHFAMFKKLDQNLDSTYDDDFTNCIEYATN